MREDRHVESAIRVYSFSGMLQVCFNPRNPAFKYYGGVGVAVSDEWRHSFETFFADMGTKPDPKHILKLVDQSGAFSKENCVWGGKRFSHEGASSVQHLGEYSPTMPKSKCFDVSCIRGDRILNFVSDGMTSGCLLLIWDLSPPLNTRSIDSQTKREIMNLVIADGPRGRNKH